MRALAEWLCAKRSSAGALPHGLQHVCALTLRQQLLVLHAVIRTALLHSVTTDRPHMHSLQLDADWHLILTLCMDAKLHAHIVSLGVDGRPCLL